MRHRIAFCVASALAVSAGCAGVLGLEDRHLESDSAAPIDGEAGEPVTESGASDTSSPMDAFVDAPPDSPCELSTDVYEFETTVGGRGYVINRDDAPPATPTQRAFGLLDPRAVAYHSVPFTAQRSDAGDYIVTFRLDAEAPGYEPFERLENMGDNPKDAAPPPGLVSIERFLNDAGTAHRFATHDGDVTDGWSSDGNHHWWVCP